ncbi:unnamed protein product, partial [Laminaria digitata]
MVLLQDGDGSGQGWLALNNDLVVDTVPPYVLNVESSKRNEEYGAGEEIDVTITFDYPVVILPGAVLLLGTGGAQSSGMAPYLSGNGSNALTFLYTVAEGDESVDLGTYEGGEAGAGGGLV